jgi:ADP-heptose:LPS heptosyltransferase
MQIITHPQHERPAMIAGRWLAPGSALVVTEINAREFRAAGGRYRARPVGEDYRPYWYPADLDGKSLLMVRPGGVGDLLFLTPTLRHLRQTFPGARLAVSAFPKLLEILAGNPNLDELIPYPIGLDRFRRFDYHVDFEDVIENNADARRLPAVDCIAGWLGLRLPDDGRRPELWLTRDDRRAVRYLADKPKGETWVGIQARASSPVRNYPLASLARVATALAAAGHRVFIIGQAGQWGRWRRTTVRNGRELTSYVAGPEGVTDLTGRFASIRRAAAFLEALDLLIAPDSALVHIAGALGVPTLALYGPFPARLRTGDYPRCAALQGEAECAPCFAHGLALPCGRPTCAALERIEPEAVVEAAGAMVSGALECGSLLPL